MRLGQAPARISRKISKRMGSDLILDELWENHRTLTVPETVGKVASFVVYLLFAMAFAGSLVYYSFFQSATATTEVSLLSMEDISGTMPNASKLEDGQSETHTEWTCKMINPYPLAPTSDKVTSEVTKDQTSGLSVPAGTWAGSWTPLLENQLPDTTFVKRSYPATLAPDLVQKYKESMKLSDADFMSYCDLLKEKGHISDKEKTLCVEMFTQKFPGPKGSGVEDFLGWGITAADGTTVGVKGYDIETFGDGSNGDANGDTGTVGPDPLTDSPILRVTAVVPDLFENGITLPVVTPGLQFPSTSYQECMELINTTVTVDNMNITYLEQGSAREDVIIRDLTNELTIDPCDSTAGPCLKYDQLYWYTDEYQDSSGSFTGKLHVNMSRPCITFPGSPLGMPFFFNDISRRMLYGFTGMRDDWTDEAAYIHTDIMLQEGKTKKFFRIIPAFNEEIVRNAFRHAGLPLNASEICEFYRHRGPYQCSHTHTVTTRYAGSR
jgi:hypothetical protein